MTQWGKIVVEGWVRERRKERKREEGSPEGWGWEERERKGG